jgi:uncharacterized cupredoxin-like copper-binding protein
MKRILSLLAAAAVIAAAVFVLAPFAGARTTSTTVSVTAKEYKFVLSRRKAPHGKTIFKVVNRGKLRHDFKIAGHKTPLLKPGAHATLTVTLTKGKHRYICTVAGHATLGMKGVFTST